MTRGREDIDSPQAVTEYFERLYHDSGSAVDLKDIVKSFEEGVPNHQSFPFRTAAEKFCIIENNTWTVLVPRDGRSREIAAMFDRPGFKADREIFREMGQYCVNIYENHCKELSPSLHIVDEKLAVLTVPNLYDQNTGLTFENGGGYGLFIET